MNIFAEFAAGVPDDVLAHDDPVEVVEREASVDAINRLQKCIKMRIIRYKLRLPKLITRPVANLIKPLRA